MTPVAVVNVISSSSVVQKEANSFKYIVLCNCYEIIKFERRVYDSTNVKNIYDY